MCSSSSSSSSGGGGGGGGGGGSISSGIDTDGLSMVKRRTVRLPLQLVALQLPLRRGVLPQLPVLLQRLPLAFCEIAGTRAMVTVVEEKRCKWMVQAG